MSSEMSISKPIGPEDVRPGDYIAVLHVVYEDLPLLCAGDERWTSPQPMRYLLLPCGDPEPLKVMEVCLPFALVKRPVPRTSGAEDSPESMRILDLRRYRVTRLSERYGKKVFKHLQSRSKRSARSQSE